MKKIIYFLRDAISFIIYALIFFRKSTGKITLVYHSVGNINPASDPHKINVLPENFEKHLKIISAHKDRIDITFDDGYHNNFQNAFPLLQKHYLTATFFLITDFIDGKIKSESFTNGDFVAEALRWEDIKVMNDAGMRFGSHSKTHRVLTEIPEDELKKELVEAKVRMEDVLGVRVDSFAYPFGNAGSFNGHVKKILAETKFHYAFTNMMGHNTPKSDRLALKRIRIYNDDGPFKLRMKIKGAYNWVDHVAAL